MFCTINSAVTVSVYLFVYLYRIWGSHSSGYEEFYLWDIWTCKKVKLSLEGVWGTGCIGPQFLDVGTSWR
jgi:hypothetical protein